MLIFIPGKSGANSKNLAAAGLTDLMRQGDTVPVCVDLPELGPGKLPGQIWGWIDDAAKVQPEPLTYQPGQQTWIAAADGRYWVGWSNSNPPSPESLQRSEMIDGPLITLADGREWQIISSAGLPRQAQLVEGQWSWAPQSRFARFVERSVWAFDVAKNAMRPDDTFVVPVSAVEYALEVLNWNYRITPELVSHLGLFRPTELFELLVLSTDVRGILRIEESLKNGVPAAIPSG